MCRRHVVEGRKEEGKEGEPPTSAAPPLSNVTRGKGTWSSDPCVLTQGAHTGGDPQLEVRLSVCLSVCLWPDAQCILPTS